MSEATGAAGAAGGNTGNAGVGASGAAGAGGAGAQGSGNAGGAGAGSAGAGAAGGQSQSDWLAGISPEQRGFIEAKKFDGVGTLVDSYKGLEKLIGVPKDRLATIPERTDDVDGWNKFYEQMGRPKTAEEYGLKTPEKGGDPEFTKWAAGLFHEMGLNKPQAEKFQAKWDAMVQEKATGMINAHNTKWEAETAALKREWGAAFETKREMANQAMQKFGVTKEMADKLEAGMGVSGLMKFLSNVGEATGQAKYVAGGGNGFSGPMTPDAARHTLKNLGADKAWMDRWQKGGQQEREHFENLNKWALADGAA